MFQRELCRHPDIAHVQYTPHSNFETHHWLKGAVMLGLPEEEFSGGKRYRGYGSARNARTYLIDCVKGNVPDYTPPTEDRQLLFDSWEALCERYARPVFFEKSPQYLANRASIRLLLEWAEQTEHLVRIIGLTRNPMSVMYSALQQFHTAPTDRQFGWMEIQENLLALREELPAGMFLHCRYEDIIESPAQTFAQLTRFIGVSDDPGPGSGVHARSREKWRDDSSFTFELDPHVQQFASHFGYTAPDLHNPHGNPRPMKTGVAGKLSLARNRFFDRVLKPLVMAFKHRD